MTASRMPSTTPSTAPIPSVRSRMRSDLAIQFYLQAVFCQTHIKVPLEVFDFALREIIFEPNIFIPLVTLKPKDKINFILNTCIRDTMVVPKEDTVFYVPPMPEPSDPCPIRGYCLWSDFFFAFSGQHPNFLKIKYDSRELVDLQEEVNNKILASVKSILTENRADFDAATLKRITVKYQSPPDFAPRAHVCATCVRQRHSNN